MFKRFKSFSFKVAFAVGVVGALVLGTSVFISTKRAADQQRDLTEALASNELKKSVGEMDATVNRGKAYVESIAARQSLDPNVATDKQLETYLAKQLDLAPKDEIFGLYYYAEDMSWKDPMCGQYITRATWPKNSPTLYEYHAEDQPWYWTPRQTGEPTLTEPYFDAGGADISMVSYTMPVFNSKKKFLGVAGGDISTESIIKRAKDLKLDLGKGSAERQVAIVASPEGKLIAHPNKKFMPRKDYEGGQLKECPEYKFVKDKADGVANAVIDGKRCFLVWTTSKITGWKTILRVPESDMMAAVNASTRQNVIFGLIGLAVMVGLVAFVSKKLAAPLAWMAADARRVAAGDVDVDITFTSNDEIGQLANAFRDVVSTQKERAEVAKRLAEGNLTANVEAKSDRDALGKAMNQMVETWREIVSRLTSRSAELSSTANELASDSGKSLASIDEVATSTRQVAQATQDSAQSSEQIARASESLAEAATRSANEMEKLRSSIDAVLKSSAAQLESASGAIAATNQGAASVDQTNEAMDRIRTEVMHSADVVKQLGERQDQIKSIVGAIDDIAQQTNLLALNAAIEAARAGEQGRGFAVVADEVRKLAERSSQATKEIGDLIEIVSSGVQSAIDTMQSSAEAVEAGTASSASTKLALNAILEATHELESTINENQSLVSEMNAGASVVNEAISNVAAISEETAAGAQELTASAEEVSASVQFVANAVDMQRHFNAQISSRANEQMEVAQNLNDIVDMFDVESEAKPHLRLAA